MSEKNDLASQLAHRQALNEDDEMPRRHFNLYTEFKEFRREQIRELEKEFES